MRRVRPGTRVARQGRWLTLCAALSMSALQGCFVAPTYAKWKLALGPHNPDRLVVGTDLEIAAAFAKGCSAKLHYLGNGTMCVDLPDSDRNIQVAAAVSDPSVFSIASSGNKIRVRALREGSATLNVTATNRRGQKLSDSMTLTAGAPTGVDVEIVRYVQLKNRTLGTTSVEKKSGCDGNRNPARLWFAAGQPFTLVYHLLGSGSRLVNAPLGMRLSGKPGITQVSYEEITGQGTVIYAEGKYVMSEPGTFAISSSTVPGFGRDGGAYDCRTLTGIAFTEVNRDASHVWLDVAQVVGGDAVCIQSETCPITVTSLTPDVCLLTGSKPTLKVQGYYRDAGAYEVSPGTCKVSASLDGTTHAAQVEFVFK